MAIALVGAIQSGQAATRTLTFTDTLLNAAGSLNRCIVCCVSNFSPSNGATRTVVTGITYNGVSMHEAVQLNSSTGSSAHAAIFYLLEAELPATGGGYAVVVDTPFPGPQGSNYISACCIEFTGVDSLGATGSQAQPSGSNNNTPGVTLTTTAANSMLVDCVSPNDFLTGTVSGSTGQTSRFQFNDGAAYSQLDSTCLTTTIGSYTMSWVENKTPARQVMVVAELIPYVPPSDTSPLMWAGSEF